MCVWLWKDGCQWTLISALKIFAAEEVNRVRCTYHIGTCTVLIQSCNRIAAWSLWWKLTLWVLRINWKPWLFGEPLNDMGVAQIYRLGLCFSSQSVAQWIWDGGDIKTNNLILLLLWRKVLCRWQTKLHVFVEVTRLKAPCFRQRNRTVWLPFNWYYYYAICFMP